MTDEVEQEKKMNPIAVAITTFLHALRDAEEVVNFYVPVAGRLHNKRIDELKEEAEQAKELSEKDDLQSQVLGTKAFLGFQGDGGLGFTNALISERIEIHEYLHGLSKTNQIRLAVAQDSARV